MKFRSYSNGGLNLFVNPLLQKEGDLIRSVNVDAAPYGAITKRSGYITYLGTADNSQVDSLFNWTKDDGTTFFNYRSSGGTLYYSNQGTGAWAICGNGTLTAGTPVGNAVLDNTLIIGDGVTAVRHTTNGTSFTNTSGAPVAPYLAQYQNRIYTGGTGNLVTYSVTGDPTNWNTTGTSDSSSLTVPGAGKVSQLFVAADRLNIPKNSGNIARWDGFNLMQVPTTQGPSSPQSLVQIEDFWFYLNRSGVESYNGDRPSLISNPVQSQIYNNTGSAIIGTTFNNAPAGQFQYKYMISVGTITENLTNETIPNAVIVYDYEQNKWGNYTYANRPTAWLNYRDSSGVQQMLFGAENGQVYQLAGTALSDNGASIEAIAEGVLNFGSPESNKKLNYMWAFFNPGAQAKVQVAITDTFTKGKKKWMDLGDCNDGVVEFRFPSDSLGKLLHWKIYESSRNSQFVFHGFTVDADIEEKT